MAVRRFGAERVLLVHVNFPSGKMEQDLCEFKELAASAGADVIAVITGTRQTPEAKYFVGTGKAEEICNAVKAQAIDLVLFNHNLSPAQERNLERLLHCRVLDRTGLILDIFAQRARSFEGKLQVELALLNHLATRLIRGWTHLERQRGGIGLRGPGETQLEVDRRLIRKRIKVISEKLEKIRQQRQQSRRARRKNVVPTVALVGYTNAGKSTLFNRLTGDNAYVANQLFATLDPTLRRIVIPGLGTVILADTVGFIRHLPHSLVVAFHATLEEVSEADLLLHVIDVSDENKISHIEQVNLVLNDIQAQHVPRLLVYNKIDLCNNPIKPKLDCDEQGNIKRVYISAAMGLGLNLLQAALITILGKEMLEHTLVLPPIASKVRASLYAKEAVFTETIDHEGNYHLTIRLPRAELEKILSQINTH